MLPGRKRARTTAGGRSAAQRAAIGAYYARKYPYSDFGRMYVPKGYDTAAIGRSYRSATAAQRAMRKKLNYHGVGMYTGQGGFWKTLKKYGKKAWHSGLGKRMRSFAADELAMAAGGFVPGAGGPVRDALRKAGLGMYTGGGMYTGSGGYQQVANDLIAGGHETEGIMRFDVQNDEDCILISHSEYVMDVYAPPKGETLANIKLPLNAAQSKTFPMLSQIAANFEDYQIVQLGFTYKPTLSDWQTTNGQVGQVLIATNYNPEAPLWTTKQQLLAQTGSTSARTIDTTMHGVECDPSKHHNDGHYLTRTGPPRPDEDLNDYDHGWTQVTVVDTPADSPNITLGELHVSYTIKLSKPRIWQGAQNVVPRTLFEDWTLTGNLSNEEQGGGQSQRLSLTSDQCDKMLKAKQSTVDCKLVKTSLPALPNRSSSGVLFPANLAGTFRLVFDVGTDQQGLFLMTMPQGQIRYLSNVASSALVGDAPDDIPGTYGTFDGLWRVPKFASLTAPGANTRTLAYVDIQINVARDGVDNIMFFGFATTTGDQQSKINYFMLDVTGLNTSLQWRQDGSNDTNIMVDKNDQIITF